MPAFADLMYIQYWIEPVLEAVTFDSVLEVQQNLPTMRQELKAIENQVKFGTFVNPQQIIIFKYLLGLINDPPGQVIPEHVAEFKQLVITQGKAFVANLEDLCNNNIERLEHQIAARLQAEAAQAAQVVQNTQALQVQRDAVAADLYDPLLTAAEREQMRRYGINPTTRAPEARLCINLDALYQDVCANLETSDADVIKELNDRFKQVTVNVLRLGNLNDPEITLQAMQITIENFKILFTGRWLTIAEYKKMPFDFSGDVKEFIYQQPDRAMQYYRTVDEREFITIIYCLIILDKIDELEKLSRENPDFATKEGALLMLIRVIFNFRLSLPIDTTKYRLTRLRGLFLNLLNIFKSNAISLMQFRALSRKTKKLFCENPDVLLQLLLEQQITLTQLQKLEPILPKIANHIIDIREYCINYGTSMQEFFSRDPTTIKNILAALAAPPKKIISFKTIPAATEIPLATAIAKNDYSTVFKLIGDETVRRHFGKVSNILDYTKEGLSYYALALQVSNIEIITLVLKAIIAATDAKLRRFLRANGFALATNLNARNAAGETPLTCALKNVTQNQTAVVLGLLARNADVQKTNTHGESPANLVSRYRDPTIVNDIFAAVKLQSDKQLFASLRARIY